MLLEYTNTAKFFITDESKPPNEIYARFSTNGNDYAMAISKTNAKGLFEVSIGRSRGQTISWKKIYGKGDMPNIIATLVEFIHAFSKSKYGSGALAFYINFPREVVGGDIERYQKFADKTIKSKFPSLALHPVTQSSSSNDSSIFMSRRGGRVDKIFQAKLFQRYNPENPTEIFHDDLALVQPVKPMKKVLKNNPSGVVVFKGYEPEFEDGPENNDYRIVGLSLFMNAMSSAQAKHGGRGLMVSEPEKGATLYLHQDGQSGFALEKDYIGSVFSMPGLGRLGDIMDAAESILTDQNIKQLRLDCFEPLGKIYARHGFKVTGTVKFDWQYAPPGWTEEMGEPDVLFMTKKF